MSDKTYADGLRDAAAVCEKSARAWRDMCVGKHANESRFRASECLALAAAIRALIPEDPR